MRKTIGLLLGIFLLAIISTAFSMIPNQTQDAGVVNIIVKEMVQDDQSWLSVIQLDGSIDLIELKGLGMRALEQDKNKRENLVVLNGVLNDYKSQGYSVVAYGTDGTYKEYVLSK